MMTNVFILATDVKRSLSYKAPDRRRQRNPEISPPLTKVIFIQSDSRDIRTRIFL